ncbi:MAG: hypothetical protein CMJ81_19160 [Planctomycetaceae bacterium]|nr:hypothetical protein [Planctomycetaceae bacterium]MBP61638.1 hypothetical protein [Planctomycetaceae bacterium]
MASSARSLRLPLFALLSMLLLGKWCLTPVAAAPPGWTTDISKAIEQALAENKDLLMNFTGSDWCPICVQLENEVFGQQSFLEQAKEHFVLVELDFPNDRSNQSPELIEQNENWRKKLFPSGYPTVYLLDAEGRPYAKTGYLPGGPQRYLANLKELRQTRERRNELLDLADSTVGSDQARYLDQALETVGINFAMTGYDELVQLILQLDDQDSAGLKSKYKRMLAGYQQMLNSREIQELRPEVFGILQRAGVEKALERVEQLEHKVESGGELGLEITLIKTEILVESNRLTDALKVFDDAIANATDLTDQVPLYFYKSNLLVYSEMTDEAIQAVDKAIDLAEGDALKRHLLNYREKLTAELADSTP